MSRKGARFIMRVEELKRQAADGAVMAAQRALERLTEIATGARDPISLRALELLGRHHQLFGDRRVGLSITSLDRSRLLPEVPTVREAGLPEAETEVWIGLFAPARTPDAVIATL